MISLNGDRVVTYTMAIACAYNPQLRPCSPNTDAHLPNLGDEVLVEVVPAGIMIHLLDDANEKKYTSGPWSPTLEPDHTLSSLERCVFAPFN